MAGTRQASRAGPVERLLRRDKLIVTTALAAIFLGAAIYTVLGVGMDMSALQMTPMARPIGQPMQMGEPRTWTLGYAILIFLMWWIMMIAMMTPSVAPVLLLFTALKRHGPESDRATLYSLVFLGGYLACWAGFSLLAAALQSGAEQAGLAASAMMTVNSRALAGLLLLAAGLYQFTALKEACIAHCRSPAQFLADHNRPGGMGAFRIGVLHGAYCLGCCWALMALLFVGGVMNLYWIAGLALYVLAEKLVPGGRYVTTLAGTGLAGAGAYFFVTAFL